MEIRKELLLSKIVEIAEEAGRAIIDIYSGDSYEVTYKSGGSPLTSADMASHNIILEQLKMITPDIPVLSEESGDISYEERKKWKTFWLVDPLDGTKEFIKRNGEFTVNIALIEGECPVLGVVCAPDLQVTYFAMKGKGAFKKNYKDDVSNLEIHVSEYHTGRISIVASRSHGNEMMERFKKDVGDADYISMGSSLKLCLVAEGKAHLYPRLGPTMEWDTAAAHCVVESAGGAVTDLAKQSLSYNKPDLHNPFFVVSGSPAFPWWKYINDM